MSKIKNIGKKRNFIIEAFRETIEHRAAWLYLLCAEAEKKGLQWEDFAPKAITKYGTQQGKYLVERGRTRSLFGLKFLLFTLPAQWVFDMKIIKSRGKEFAVDFHYCPLVKGWQKQGCSDSEIARLCDIAMCGDHGIAKAYGAKLKIEKRIAYGDDRCTMRYRSSEGSKNSKTT